MTLIRRNFQAACWDPAWSLFWQMMQGFTITRDSTFQASMYMLVRFRESNTGNIMNEQ